MTLDTATIDAHLHELTRFEDRHVGGPGNRAATAYFAEKVAAFGWHVASSEFDCLEWEFGTARIVVGRELFSAHVGPYSLPIDQTVTLAAASTVEEIEAGGIEGALLLLHGAITAGQLMPKAFTFYNPAEHKRIIAAIETAAPAAVVAATGTDPYMVGGQSPFPLFEDGDFDIPNAYLLDTVGERLLADVGASAAVTIESRRIPATADHVIATLPGTRPGRIVVSAHIDSRKGSPGALDNATGVATLLGLAELLGGSGEWDGPSIELVPFNGEDNYANPGELLWEADNEGRWGDIVLGINVDDSGQRDAENNVSFYGCPLVIEAAVREAMTGHDRLSEGPQWGQGDHAILGLHGVPAIAVASSEMYRFMEQYAHTEKDTLDLADCALVADAAHFIHKVIEGVSRLSEAGDAVGSPTHAE
jgi:aminopeptidase YwaD